MYYITAVLKQGHIYLFLIALLKINFCINSRIKYTLKVYLTKLLFLLYAFKEIICLIYYLFEVEYTVLCWQLSCSLFVGEPFCKI